jgi:predicted HD phosphohydrolase
MPATRMAQRTIEDWATVRESLDLWQSRVPARIRALLLQLDEQPAGFGVTQLNHSLQTATRALRAGASEHLIVAALCHDIGTAISLENHSAIAAEILKPYVTSEVYEVVRAHQDFQRSHYDYGRGRDTQARQKYADEKWFELACRFSDEWDQASFDPNYETLPLDHFQPMIERVFERTLNGRPVPASRIRKVWRRVRSLLVRRGSSN